MNNFHISVTNVLYLIIIVTGTLTAKVTRDDALKASLHFSRVLSDAKCSTPFPRVVKLNELFPNSGKKFVPSCTLIHYCGEETGCCQQENQRCSPLKQQQITLYFWVVELTNRGQKRGIEKVTLFNDTECYCRNNSPDDNRIPMPLGSNETKKLPEASSMISLSSYTDLLTHQRTVNLYESRSARITTSHSRSNRGLSNIYRTSTTIQPYQLYFWCTLNIIYYHLIFNFQLTSSI